MTEQLTLDGDRDGRTYAHAFDYDRLNRQMRLVYDVMRDGQWHTLRGLASATGCPEASVSARLRDFRKERFGGLTIEAVRLQGSNGLYRYRLVMHKPEPLPDPDRAYDRDRETFDPFYAHLSPAEQLEWRRENL